MSTAFATDLQDFQRRELAERVALTLDAVRRRGDDALHGQGPRGGADRRLALPGGRRVPLRLGRADIDRCLRAIPRPALDDLQTVQNEARRLADAQRAAIADFETAAPGGGRIGVRYAPVASVGICVPDGGGSPSIGTIQSAAVSARAAGVPRVVAGIGHPDSDGDHASALMVAALTLAGIDEIYSVGGVHALGAFGFGTESMPRVDRLVLGGGAVLEEAGRQLPVSHASGSGILIIADDSAVPDLVAADLVTAGECGPGARGVLITTSPALAARVAGEVERQLDELGGAGLTREAWRRGGAIHVVGDREAACALADHHGCARVEVMTLEPRWFLHRLNRCCDVFLGAGAGILLADVAAAQLSCGTIGGAHTRSVASFVRAITFRESEAADAATGRAFARHRRVTGLEAHARACELRVRHGLVPARGERALAAVPLG